MPQAKTAEALRAELRDIKYQYEKTGFYELAMHYHVLADRLLRMGEKPEHLPLLRKQA